MTYCLACDSFLAEDFYFCYEVQHKIWEGFSFWQLVKKISVYYEEEVMVMTLQENGNSLGVSAVVLQEIYCDVYYYDYCI